VGFKRHVLVGICSLLLFYLFLESRPEWNQMHSWNRAFADASFVLLVITILIGPLSRLKFFARFLPWRRELGIWCAIMALLHVYILFKDWFYWEPVRLVIGVSQETGRLTFDPGFALANLIGAVAILYLLMLALISNNAAVKLLGKKSWDYLQQKSGIPYLLVTVHTAFFLFIFRLESDNWMKVPFLVTISTVFVVQWSVFGMIVIKNRKR
jgi:methionine sulfoxide reductase heme-binding subunit